MRRSKEVISDKGFPFPNWDLEDSPEVQEECSDKITPKEMDSWLQTPSSPKRWKWSKWSFFLVGLLCVALGVLQLTVISFMKPKVKSPQLVSERIRFPIPSIEREEEITIPRVVGRKEREEEGTLEHEEPTVSKPPEPSMMIPERWIDEKVAIIGALGEDERTHAGERHPKDTILGQEILQRDTRIKGKTPKTISVGEEPSAREIHEKSVRGMLQSRPITAGAVELERETGRIEVTPTKASEPREMSVRQPNQLSHTEDRSITRALKKYDAPRHMKDKGISAGRLPIDSSSSIEREKRIIQIKTPSLIATEEEVENFFAEYRERYARKDLEGLFSLFSSRAVENGRYGIEEMKKIYSDFFGKSQRLRYHIEETKIEIYQNGVEVKGRYKIEQTAKKGGKQNVWWGDIRWVLVRETGVLKISLLDYRPHRSS